MEFTPITYEMWEAFALERQQWEIVEVDTNYIATDRKRFLHDKAFHNPMEVSFHQEICGSRNAAAFYIGLRAMEVALTTTGIIHANS